MKENNPYENQKPQKKPSTKEKLRMLKEKTQKPPVQKKATRMLHSAQTVAPIDHQAATKKLNDIMRQCSPSRSHADMVKSLPSFKEGKTSFS